MELFETLSVSTLLLGAITYIMKIFISKEFEKNLSMYKLNLNKEMETYKMNIKSVHERNTISYVEKIDLYKTISDPIISLIIEVHSTGTITQATIDNFEVKRLNITASLVMFAPASVFHSFNELIDYFYNCVEGKDTYTFDKFRPYAMTMLSAMRKDIGLFDDEITYIGNR